MMKTVIVIFVLIFMYANQAIAVSEQAQLLAPYSMEQYNQVISKLYQNQTKSHSKNLTDRLIVDSSIFIGKPYHEGALGEGSHARFDQSPLYRTDAFDCMTFTSTVLALVESNNLNQFKYNIKQIRYMNGEPSFFNRNHFASVDWNLHNQAKGYVTNITKIIFPYRYQLAVAMINKSKWYSSLKANSLKYLHPLSRIQTNKLLMQLHLLANQAQIETSRLPYISLKELYKNNKPDQTLFNRIPSASVIEIVRPNWNLVKLIGTHLNVSHLGFVFRLKGILYFREASSLNEKVMDIPLTDYLKHYLKSKTVKGISILKIQPKVQ